MLSFLHFFLCFAWLRDATARPKQSNAAGPTRGSWAISGNNAVPEKVPERSGAFRCRWLMRFRRVFGEWPKNQGVGREVFIPMKQMRPWAYSCRVVSTSWFFRLSILSPGMARSNARTRTKIRIVETYSAQLFIWLFPTQAPTRTSRQCSSLALQMPEQGQIGCFLSANHFFVGLQLWFPSGPNVAGLAGFGATGCSLYLFFFFHFASGSPHSRPPPRNSSR